MINHPEKVASDECRPHGGGSPIFFPTARQTDKPCRWSPDVLCRDHHPSGTFHDIEGCIACSVFKGLAELDPHGWSHFVGEQIRSLTLDFNKTISKREEDLLRILDNLPDGLFTMDKEGRVTYFNPAAERITGICATDAIGMHCRQLFRTTTCQIECFSKKNAQIAKNVYNREFAVPPWMADPCRLFQVSPF